MLRFSTLPVMRESRKASMIFRSFPHFPCVRKCPAVYIIVPYRNREEHLRRFLGHMARYFRAQCVHILVIEQADSAPFNRGALLNVGVRLLRHHTNWVTFHDVDMLPLNMRDAYSISSSMRHLATRVEQFGFVLPYMNYLGGVLVADLKVFEAINGFSNDYQGWGCEDDDLFLRTCLGGFSVDRAPVRFLSLSHPPSQPGVENTPLFAQMLKLSVEGSNGLPVDPRSSRRTSFHQLRCRPKGFDLVTATGLSTVHYHTVNDLRPLAWPTNCLCRESSCNIVSVTFQTSSQQEASPQSSFE